MKKVILLKTDGNVLAYDTIQAAVTAGASGDCVVVYPGTYDQGSSSLIIKDGVDIECIGKVTISSSNTTATIVDNNVAAVMSLKGFPTITNSNGLDKRIVLANAGSKINDFWWCAKFNCFIYINGSSTQVTGINYFINTLGEVPTFNWNADDEVLELNFTDPILKQYKYFIENPVVKDVNEAVLIFEFNWYNERKIVIRPTPYLSSEVAMDSPVAAVTITVYP